MKKAIFLYDYTGLMAQPWIGGGSAVPEKLRIEPLHKDNPGWKKCGGKSKRTKNIRSATPRGFAKAWFLANKSY